MSNYVVHVEGLPDNLLKLGMHECPQVGHYLTLPDDDGASRYPLPGDELYLVTLVVHPTADKYRQTGVHDPHLFVRKAGRTLGDFVK